MTPKVSHTPFVLYEQREMIHEMENSLFFKYVHALRAKPWRESPLGFARGVVLKLGVQFGSSGCNLDTQILDNLVS